MAEPDKGRKQADAKKGSSMPRNSQGRRGADSGAERDIPAGTSASGPDFQKIDPAMAAKADFPATTSGEYRVHFHRQAHEAMMSHAATTSEVELCGVLVGDVCADSQGFFLDIVGAIEAQGANNYGSQVTLTHEAWSHIHAIKDQRYPDKRIVGWYHTHPGFGVFLSGMDMFIQENFFREPYQVAVVIETRQKAEGCFYWSRGKAVPARRYWVGDREVPLASGTAEPFDIEKQDTPAAPRQDRPARAGGVDGGVVSSATLMLLAVMMFAAGMIADQFLISGRLKDVVQEAAESQVLSVVETAAKAQLSVQDFEQLRNEVKTIRDDLGSLDGSKPTTDRLTALDARMEVLQQEFGKRQSSVRRDLETMAQVGPQLRERVATLQALQGELDKLVANLYLIRLADAVGGTGRTVDMGALSDTNRQLAQQCLETLIRRHPEVKQQLKSMFPGLLEYFYPQEKPPEPAPAAPPAEGEKKVEAPQ